MASTLQTFLATSTTKAAEDLEAALKRLPEDKRAWSSMGDARTALDQAAECAMLNGSTAELIRSRKWNTEFDFEGFLRAKVELAKAEHELLELLHKNTADAVAAIAAVPDADLGISVDMPWGPMTLAQIISYPYWNMSYHQGQINYIATMLGVEIGM